MDDIDERIISVSIHGKMSMPNTYAAAMIHIKCCVWSSRTPLMVTLLTNIFVIPSTSAVSVGLLMLVSLVRSLVVDNDIVGGTLLPDWYNYCFFSFIMQNTFYLTLNMLAPKRCYWYILYHVVRS